jgi:hypothetical protein
LLAVAIGGSTLGIFEESNDQIAHQVRERLLAASRDEETLIRATKDSQRPPFGVSHRSGIKGPGIFSENTFLSAQQALIGFRARLKQSAQHDPAPGRRK